MKTMPITIGSQLNPNGRPDELRIHDLIAKIAHVRLKDTLRVLLALKAIHIEYGLPVPQILEARASMDKPNSGQAAQCQKVYTWMYDNPEIQRILFGIEQLR